MPDHPLGPDYLSLSEAADYLAVSSQTLRRWDSSGKLKAVRHPGNSYRYFKRADLEPFRLDYKYAASQAEAPGVLFREALVNIEENDRLREPQREAHRRVWEHFAENSDPAILQIPVGCGKTGVMATLPFGISEDRVLVIAPNVTIREGVSQALDITSPKCFWNKTRVLNDFSRGPFRAVLDGPDANLHDCTESHFVITNIQQLASSADRWLPQFPPNFFDMILVDEGHHNAADSWRKVFERFPEAKIVSLTATPFRSDGKPLTGGRIYSYPYAQAMIKGYIKQIHSINVAPSEIYFTYEGDSRHHTLDEVLDLREEAWFRRGVALAPECNRHLVEASILRCLGLRERTGLKHQIIAAACSVDHSRQVRRLYEARGLEAREIHSDMDADQRAKVLEQLNSHQIDCIVQVQMLGEGFDHPPLSVAAVFRPFRSLSAYIQFIGRIMRVVHQNDPDHPDNQGYIVSHIGLNNDARWVDFREFDLEDQAVFQEWLWQETEPEVNGNGGHPRRFDVGMRVEDEIISHFINQSFLNPEDDRVIDRILNQKVPGTPFTLRDMITPEELRAKLRTHQEEQLGQEPQTIPVQPQRRRQAVKSRLNERERSVANRVLSELSLSRAGRDLAKGLPQVKGAQNEQALYRLVKTAVNKYLGIAARSRGKLTSQQCERALERLDTIGDQVRDRARVALEAKNS